MNHRLRISPTFAALIAATLLAGTPAVAVPTSTATLTVATVPTLRINEVLAVNTRIANAGTFPDIIELARSA
jgi:hypothetical protein